MTNISSEESLGLAEETGDLQLISTTCINRDNGSDEEVKARDQSPDGRFLKFEEIGRGSFKTVYKGLDTTTGVNLAWCELQERLSKKERERFREEVEMLKTLQHSNIVRFHDYWEVNTPKRKYLVLITELMTSGTLKTYLKKLKKINTKVLKSWCRQILKGLNFLHSRTPACDNIFITGTNGSVKIGDLGLATLKTKSFAKSVIGTPEFMPSEMYDECYDESVDVYAFGMCMIEMATGEYPYSECTTPAQIYKKVTSGTPPQCFSKIDNLELKEIIGRCIRHKKDERPTVKELLQMEFFLEDTGFKIELVEKEKFVNNLDPKIELRLIVTDAKKRKDKYKENEAIQFTFMIDKDNPDEVSMALVKNGYLTDEDVRTVASLIRSQIQCLKKEREKIIPTIQATDAQFINQQQSQQQQPQMSSNNQAFTQQHQQTPQQQSNQQQQPSQQNTPTTLTQNLVEQQTPSTLTQKHELINNNQQSDTSHTHQQFPPSQSQQHTELTNEQQTSQLDHHDVNKLSNISKTAPLINNTINSNSTIQHSIDCDNQIVSNHTATVPSSPDCLLSPGSPVKSSNLANAYILNQNLQNKFENCSVTDLSSVSAVATAATNQQQHHQSSTPAISNNQNNTAACPSQGTGDVTNSNSNQNQALQSYSCPDTPTTVNQQQPNFSNAKVSTEQIVSTVSTTVTNNIEQQLSSSTNSTNSTINNPQSTNTSTNSILPSQSVSTANQVSATTFPAKPMPANLDNLKQGEKKLSTSISSNDLKVNIEQGLQAIFASSSCPQNTNTVNSIASTTSTNNGQSTPVLNSTATQPSLISIQQQQSVNNNHAVDQQTKTQQQIHQSVTNNNNCCVQNIESNHQPINNQHPLSQSNQQALTNNHHNTENIIEQNGIQHLTTINQANAITNPTQTLNDKDHSISNNNQLISDPIYNQQHMNDAKITRSAMNGNSHSQHLEPPTGDRLKKRRFTIIPVENDTVSSENSITDHLNSQLINNNNQIESNHNHQNTASSCSNSNTISSTSSLSKTSSTEDERTSSSLSGYSTPADSISQIRSRFQVTTIEESLAIKNDTDHDGDGSIDQTKSLNSNRSITKENVVQLLNESIRSSDNQLKDHTIRFICLNYQEVSKQTEFRRLDKCVLLDIMDELADSYKVNSIRKFASTASSKESGCETNDLTI